MSPTNVPVLFILDGENEGPYWELAQFVHSKLASRNFKVRKAADIVRAVKRFIQVFDLYVNKQVVDANTLTETLSVYCYIRFSGTSLFSVEAWRQLDWSPVNGATIWAEFKLLVDFFEYCQEEFGYVSFNSAKIKYRKRSSFIRNASNQQRTRDFLVHLNTQRDCWEKLLKRGKLRLPAVIRDTKSPARDRSEKAIDENEFREIIARESNPVFKALFILYGYGGLRISEPLHFWQIDILPSSSWEKINARQSSEPLILRCHPSESKFLGSFGNGKVKRKEFLSTRYRMAPRNMLAENEVYYSGWKGTKFLHKLNFTPVFFLANKIILSQFEECIFQIQRFHQLNRTSEDHPFFFCNMSSKRHDYFGTPTTISNLQGAWNRSVKRVGLIPHENNRNLHGLRHMYIAKAQDLGLDSFQIQDIVGHSNEESQRVYGNKISKVQNYVEKAFGK